MARFVTEQLHAPEPRSAFYVLHLPFFEFLEARVGKVKRDGNARNGLGREPLARKPAGWPEAQAALLEFFVELLNPRQKLASIDPQIEVAEAQFEKFRIGQVSPFRLPPTAAVFDLTHKHLNSNLHAAH
jgi:hypothetical protein